DFGVEALPSGTILHRFHETARDANVFNPCKGKPTRFAPLFDSATSACIPTIYLGETYEAAAFESVFRDLPPLPNPRNVRASDLASRSHATVKLSRKLQLAPFFTQNLNMIGQTRSSMIESDATTYAQTVLWAAAVHASFPKVDGIIWTSRQHDRDRACALFGDRVSEKDLKPMSSEPIDIGPGRVRIGQCAIAYKVTIIP
ncbi:RES domain-containing protein, partial [Acidisoma silvae]